MCESFRPSRLQMLRYLIVPQVIPYVFMTTKSTVGYAFRMLIFAELIGSSVGIGALMGLAQASFRMDDVVALPGMSIASKQEVRSLLVVSKVPIEMAKSFALDTNSRSTVGLVRILCQKHWKIAPEFVDSAPDPDPQSPPEQRFPGRSVEQRAAPAR